MATVTEPAPRDARRPLGLLARLRARAAAIPEPVTVGIVLVVLLAISAFMRTRQIGGEFWMDEGLSVGIASHPLWDIPGLLHQDGSPPFYYMLLHVWMDIAGRSESATHALSLIFSLASIPVGLWAGWSLFGRRAGYILALLMTLNPFLTEYAQETRMYSLMAFLALIAAACFLHGFLYHRRGYLIGYVVTQVLMMYTHGWGIFFGVGAFVGLLVLIYVADGDERRVLIRDGALSFGAAAILFAPWLPTLLYQTAHTAAPWDTSPRFGAPIQLSRALFGGDRAATIVVLCGGFGLAAVFAGKQLRERRAAWLALVLPGVTLLFAWVVSQFSPSWVARYFAVLLGPLLIALALGLSRAKRFGIVVVAALMILWLNPVLYSPKYKSDVREIAYDVGSKLQRGDLVIVGQAEQGPLNWYYMPAGMRYASPLGATPDPRIMDWRDSVERLQKANPRRTALPLLASMRPGQHVLLVRPLTEGVNNWKAPWTFLVRRRSAQWSQILADDACLTRTAVAPSFYHPAFTVGNSAVLYTVKGSCKSGAPPAT